MKTQNYLLTAVSALLVLTLSACSSVKQELGVGRNSPDEFTVVKRAPLTLPPDYTLRPPAEAAAAANPAADTAAQAKTAVLGKSETTAAAGAGESALLSKAGAGAANPDIRKVIDEENGYISLNNRSVAERLIFWDDEQEPSIENVPSSVVDAKAEAARLQQNKAAGKPLNQGNVPVIEKKKGTLDKIF
jgi:hypothetical protein